MRLKNEERIKKEPWMWWKMRTKGSLQRKINWMRERERERERKEGELWNKCDGKWGLKDHLREIFCRQTISLFVTKFFYNLGSKNFSTGAYLFGNIGDENWFCRPMLSSATNLFITNRFLIRDDIYCHQKVPFFVTENFKN